MKRERIPRGRHDLNSKKVRLVDWQLVEKANSCRRAVDFRMFE
jgi:hypothetical protein